MTSAQLAIALAVANAIEPIDEDDRDRLNDHRVAIAIAWMRSSVLPLLAEEFDPGAILRIVAYALQDEGKISDRMAAKIEEITSPLDSF